MGYESLGIYRTVRLVQRAQWSADLTSRPSLRRLRMAASSIGSRPSVRPKRQLETPNIPFRFRYAIILL